MHIFCVIIVFCLLLLLCQIFPDFLNFNVISEETDCCASGLQGSDCFSISIPNPDRFYSWINSTAQCLNLIRSQPVCRSPTREQYNEITAFIDASMVYGSEQEQSAVIRTYRYMIYGLFLVLLSLPALPTLPALPALPLLLAIPHLL